MGGSLGRREATGRGCMIVTKESLKHLSMPIEGTTVAIQGFGNVGSVAADLLRKEGCKIVAISDRTGGYHNKNGIDIAFRRATAKVRSLRASPAATRSPMTSCSRSMSTFCCRPRSNVIPARTPGRSAKTSRGANGLTTAGAD
jgi:glutamate dehydrogenase (NAD(P)+)